MSERIPLNIPSPVMVDTLANFLRDELMARANRHATIVTFPEVFGEFSEAELDAMDAEQMEKMVNHFLRFSNGTNKPRGLLRGDK